MPEQFSLTKSALEDYLSSMYEAEVEVTVIRDLSNGQVHEQIKDMALGRPLVVSLQVAGNTDQVVLHTVRPGKSGLEHRADRASHLLSDYDTFNKLPQHIPCLSVGAFTKNGALMSLTGVADFFSITHYASGQRYAQDLESLLKGRNLLPDDKARALALSKYLAQIHAKKHADVAHYHRAIRELFSDSEGIFGVVDRYPRDFALASPSHLRKIETRLMDWRWRIKDRSHRLSQVHGDFHPWNIQFKKNNTFHVLDRSRGEWGEPADDVSALSINYLFFSLQRHNSLQGPFRVLFETFWDQYLQETQDVEILNIVQPYFAWRALVLAQPARYPQVEPQVRKALFTFVDRVLEQDVFDPQQVNTYLA